MAGSYNPFLVILSALIAALGSYASLDLAERVTTTRGRLRLAWLSSGSIAMGIGIWSMHFTAMLAFRLSVPIYYHWPTVLASLLVAILASALALSIVSMKRLVRSALFTGSIFQGGAIASMHYMAMAAMRMAADVHYSPAIVALSILVAVAGSLLSLRLAFFFRDGATGRRLRMAGGAVLMGSAITAMQYTGMAAARFTASGVAPDLTRAVRVTLLGASGISGVALMVLAVTLLTSLADRLQERNTLLDCLFDQAPQAVALMNGDYCVDRINLEFTRLFGYTREEAAGHALSELIVPDDLRGESQRKMERVSHGDRVDAETVRRRKDGTRLQVVVVGVPMSLPGGRVAIFAMYRDITERKAAETALQGLSKRLIEVQEAERRHLARELHDEIGQLLTGLRMLLRLNGDLPPDAYRSRFDQARELVDDLLGRVRGLSFDLRPADLDQLGLLPALLALFERYTAQTGIQVNFRHQGVERRFPPQIETGAYRIAQEALTNVARHAGVAGVTVRLWADGEKLRLQIADRGCGFDRDTVVKSPRSSGLLGMRERTMMLGGDIAIESSPGSGTTITAELPFGESATP